jgi:cyclopropane fatty-acyl-phospholipid synthase-like methyltransferase
MSARPVQPVPIDSAAYTEDYYLSGVEGHQLFRETSGRALTPRLTRALELAAPRGGERLLDIGCGRGEVVLQSALRGATALGIDYADAALSFARRSVDGASAGVARMDATQVALRSGSFDVAVMLDFVEHVHQPHLEQAFREVAGSLRSGGRLVVHTSPNRLLEETVYPRYVRNVHRALGAVGRLFRRHNWFFNEIVLPTDPIPSHDAFERALHVNPQSARSLRHALERCGFLVRRVDFWEPPHEPFFPKEQRLRNAAIALLDALRFLRPLSRWPPLDRFFSNHIWIVAERR